MDRSRIERIRGLTPGQQADLIAGSPQFQRDIEGRRRSPSGPPREPRKSFYGQVLIVVFISLLTLLIGAAILDSSAPPAKTDISSAKTEISADRLWEAICTVESGGDPLAEGDAGLAVGIAQIQPVMVRDINRILGREVFTLEDRTSPRISRLMFDVFRRHYGPEKPVEWIARAWNGGPQWDTKPPHVQRRTERYWHKVRGAIPRTADENK